MTLEPDGAVRRRELAAIDLAGSFAGVREEHFPEVMRGAIASVASAITADRVAVHVITDRDETTWSWPTTDTRSIPPPDFTISETCTVDEVSVRAVVEFAASPESEVVRPLVQFLVRMVAETVPRLDAEREVSAELARHRAVVRCRAEIVFVVDKAGAIRYSGVGVGDLLGIAGHDLIGTSILGIVHPDDAFRASAILAAPGETAATSRHGEVRLLNGSGEYHWVGMLASDHLADPLIDGIVVHCRDESERRRVAEALAVSEARARAILESSPDIITVVDAEGAVVLHNNAGSAMLGYPPGQTGEHMFDHIHPDDREFGQRAFVEMLTDARSAAEPTLLRIADSQGEYHYLESVARNLLDDEHVRGLVITTRDLTERMKVLADLQETGARMEAFVNSSPDGIVMTGEEFEIVLFNDVFCRMFGLEGPNAGALDVNEVMKLATGAVEDPDAFVAHTRAEVAGTATGPSWNFRFRDGRLFEREYVRVAAEGTAYGHMWVFRDVTQRDETERSMAEALDQALEASLAKSQFVATVGHEVRTPMHAILGMLELLSTETLSVEQQRTLSTVRDSALNLRAILDDLLDFAKVEAGELAVESETFDLTGALHRVIEAHRVNAAERGLDLRFDLDPEVPSEVAGDELRLRQIVINLLDNALKYTEQGHVVLRVELAGSATESSVAIRFAVEDTGCGVPADEMESLFEPFRQVSAGLRPVARGTGLGLAICRRLTELMSGTLTGESEFGKGSRFTLTLGFGVPRDTQMCRKSPEAESTLPQPALRVLVVEDDPVNQLLATRQLEHLGHTVTVVGSGEEALACLAQETFGVVLMDRRLPGIDGVETTRRLRAIETETETETGARTAVIAMTASAFNDDERACRASGMNDYLAKPVSLSALRAALAPLVPLVPLVPPPSDGSSELLRDPLELLAEELGSIDVVREIVHTYLELLPERRVAILASQDADDRSRHAHTLAGPSEIVGESALGAWCRSLEATVRAGDFALDTATFDALCGAAQRRLETWLAGATS